MKAIKLVPFWAVLCVASSLNAQNTFPSSGNVGIGTTSPSSKLVVDGVDNWSEGIILQNTSAYKHMITGYADGANPTTGSGLQFKISNNSSGGNVAALTLRSNGRVQMQGNELEFACYGTVKELNAGKIGYKLFSDAFDFVGAGTNSTNRKIKFWNEGGASFNGNVGIGIDAPVSRLQIVGSGSLNVDLKANGRIQTGDASNNGGMWVDGAQSLFIGQASATSMGFFVNGGWRLVADNNGNVGIGTSSPNQKLTVNGTIYGKEVKVDLSVPGPDYVFENSYQLQSLDNVASYITENKHLPEVPSAAEMEKNGINVSEMNMLLLKKVEELTLYLIDQNKKINEQAEQIKKLQTSISRNK